FDCETVLLSNETSSVLGLLPGFTRMLDPKKTCVYETCPDGASVLNARPSCRCASPSQLVPSESTSCSGNRLESAGASSRAVPLRQVCVTCHPVWLAPSMIGSTLVTCARQTP